MRDKDSFRPYEILHSMKQIIDQTVTLILERREQYPDYKWVNLKIDALTGIDYFKIGGIRDFFHIYSWIQGRALEALSLHIRWYRRFSGVPTPSTRKIERLCADVASSLADHQGHYLFLFQPSSESDRNDYTMSDLFVSRGLYTYHTLYGDKDESTRAKQFLNDVIDAVIDGRFYNDQVPIDTSKRKDFYRDPAKRSYAGHMLALGAVNLLMELEKDQNAVQSAVRLIDHIMLHHVNIDKRWEYLREYTIVEFIDESGQPYIDEMQRIPLDSGHALECVGLISQLLLTWKKNFDISDKTAQWMNSVEQLLPLLLKTNFLSGYHRTKGIYKSIDGITGKVIDDSMPWWSVCETMRAIACVEKLQDNERWSEWSTKTFTSLFSTFSTCYLEQSECPVALQAIDAQGNGIETIPATPDLDPGYHTNLSFITCYDIISEDLPLMFKGLETDITPVIKTRLSGHIARDGEFERIMDRLHMRVVQLRSPYGTTIILNADTLEFSVQTIKKIRSIILQKVHVTADHILVSATHSHTCPPVIPLGPLFEDDEYLLYLYEKAEYCCLFLKEQPETAVSMDSFSFSDPFGINRRLYDERTHTVAMRPNPEGPYDDTISVVTIKDEEGKLKSIWVNTHVHPTTLGVSLSVISADYPGRIRSHLRRLFSSDLLVIPFIGACGDVRPDITDPASDHFVEGTESDIDRIGREIAHKIYEIDSRRPSRKPESATITLFSQVVDLPLEKGMSKEQLKILLKESEDQLRLAEEKASAADSFSKAHNNPLWAVDISRQWAKERLWIEDDQDHLSGEFSLMSIGNELYFISIPGELFTDIAKKIKKELPGKEPFIICYAGGSLGYLPSKSALDQGGYEITDAYKFYHHSAPFSEEVEKIILQTVMNLIHLRP